MSEFKMYFEWKDGGPVGDLQPYNLEAETVEAARVKAAMVYAGASFQPIPPQAFRLEGPDGTLVYRFPERPWGSQ